MGPPPFGDGKWPKPPSTTSMATRLQWGHRLSAMERRARGGKNGRAKKASMGPPPFGDGKNRIHEDGGAADGWLQWGHRLSAMERTFAPAFTGSWKRSRRWLASMGPPPFGDGKSVLCPDAGLHAIASMGPPPFGDGKKSSLTSRACCFRWLQWGHRLSAMESCPSPLRSQSAGPGFNGATAFRRWKVERLPTVPEPDILASMGPPPFGDGKPASRAGWAASRRAASMGPPPFGDGKLVDWLEFWKPMAKLQWGHRLSAMESHTITFGTRR